MTQPTPTPTPTSPPKPEREAQVAVAPFNTIAPEDIGKAGAAFDAWLREISGNHVTLERLSMVAGSLPVVGNIIALVDVIMDVVNIVRKYSKNAKADFLDWVSLGINLVGVIPAPPSMAAARMSLRPTLHLAKQTLQNGALTAGEALITVLQSHLNDKIVGELETFIDGAIARLDAILLACADKADEMADALIDVLNRCIGKKPMFDGQPPKPATALHDPKAQSRWDRMLAAVNQAKNNAANAVAGKAAAYLPDAAVAGVVLVIAHLTTFKGEFRGSVMQLANAEAEKSIKWLLKCLLAGMTRRKKTQSVALSADKGTQASKTNPGAQLESSKNQAPAKGDPNSGKACPITRGTGGSISFATGCESFTHTDFVLRAPLPIAWSRTYRSNLSAYDQGSLGARWITPYSSRVDVQQEGKKRSLIHHGADGRSHDYPWLNVGQRYRDPVEEVTLTRLSPTLLVLDYGKPLPEGEPSPWRETYELVATCAGKIKTQGKEHFRLVALHGKDGMALGLRYDHVVGQGPNRGEQVLSDILSKQGEVTLAHVGVQIDGTTGRVHGLWEIKDGKLVRQVAGYQYNEAGDLILAQDENAAAWHYQYQDHLITRYTDRTGRGMNLAYDGTEPTSKAIREWADDGSFDVSLEWDKNIRLTIMTDALGGETWVYYDILGYTYRMIHPDQREEWFFRDAAKNVTRHVHPDGTTDDYQFDEDGNLQSHVRADGSVVHFEYDKLNRLTGILDAEGGVWRREYNVQGHLVAETDPRGFKTEYAHDAAGRPVQITDAKGGTKALSYTPSGQLSSYTDCSGQTSRWVFDERGRLYESINAQGHSTRYRYTDIGDQHLAEWETPNHPGQLALVIQADGSEEHLVHDAEGRLLSHTDALDQRTLYSYTAAGLISQRKDAMGHTLQYRWDRLGRLSELRNENDRAYQFEYDPVGRLLSEQGFDEQTTTYRYEPSTGVLSEVIEGLQTHLAPLSEPTSAPTETWALRTKLEFDPLGRLTQRCAQVPGQAEQAERFGYNANGQLVHADNAHSKLEWFFDRAGNLTREHHHDLSHQHTAIWRHRYDELNQRVGTTRPDGHTLEWLTYGSGHVHGLMLDGQERVGFERDELHREVKRSQANGLTQQQRFDVMGRLLQQSITGLQAQEPTQPENLTWKSNLAKRTAATTAKPAEIGRKYSYDKAGQLSSISDARGGSAQYRYDPVGRLFEAYSGLGREVFAFDPAGNISESKEKYHDQIRGPKANKVLDNLVKEYAGTHYEFDDRGNLTERLHQGKRTQFEWDGFNRMTRASTPDGVVSFAYDPLGRRISKHYHPNNDSQDPYAVIYQEPPKPVKHTVFGWDGDRLAYESNVFEGAGSSSHQADTVHYIHEAGSFVPLMQARRVGQIKLKPTTDVKALMASNEGRYDIELDPLWHDEADNEPLAFDEQELVYYQCDHLGTPREMTDFEGKVTWQARYKAWGLAEIAISDAARKAGIKNHIRFQGQYWDEETGLAYNRHRYYDPHSGRFVSKDPIGLNGGNNLQQYAKNPVGWTDPVGLSPKPPQTRPQLPAYDGKTTHGVLVTNEGTVHPLQSGGADPAYKNYIPASHVEGKSALLIRQKCSTGGTIYHNNTEGTCPYCHNMLPTLLPEGAILDVVPPENAVAKTARHHAGPTSYTGNNRQPKISTR